MTDKFESVCKKLESDYTAAERESSNQSLARASKFWWHVRLSEAAVTRCEKLNAPDQAIASTDQLYESLMEMVDVYAKLRGRAMSLESLTEAAKK